MGEDVFLRLNRKAVRCDQVIHVTKSPEHTRLVGAAEARHRLNERIKDHIEVDGGAADYLEYVCCCGLLLQRLPQLIEQPRILDGDHGLLREVAEQFDLLVGERTDLLAIDGDGTDYLIFPQHRHLDDRAGAAEVGQLNRSSGPFEIRGCGAYVRYLNRLLGSDCGGHLALWMRMKDLVGSNCSICRRRVVERDVA